MTSNDWQNRLLSDEELQRTLSTLGSLEGMQVLQRQLELRAAGHQQSAELRSQVSNQLDLGLTDVVPMVLDKDGIHPIEPVVESATPSAEAKPASDADIVNNLNALFAAKRDEPAQALIAEVPSPEVYSPAVSSPAVSSPDAQQSEVDTPIQPFTPVAEEVAEELFKVLSAPEAAADNLAASVPPSVEYAPKPVVSNTDSLFIPTFANPLPAADAGNPRQDPDAEEQPTEEVPVPQPNVAGEEVATSPAWNVAADAGDDLPSAEEAVTAFEEATTVNTPLPTLVDDLILSVGGVDDSGDAAAEGEVVPVYAREDSSSETSSEEPESKEPGSGIGYLLASWNGTGNLLFLIAAGFVAGLLKLSLVTLLAGAFGALVIIGIGFGTAAVTARRGRQPQATISRAVFGVRGAAIPLVFVTIARYAATAVAALASVTAVQWYFPSAPKQVTLSGLPVEVFYLALAVLMLLASLATAFGAPARRAINKIMAFASIAWIAAAIGLAIWLTPSEFSLGALNPAEALGVASTLLIVLSLIWGTTAADETPNLRANIRNAKLLAAGVLSHALVGTLAILAGFAYFSLNLAAAKGISMGVILAVAVVLSLSHQLRRTADSFSGFGVAGNKWWVLLVSAVVVTAGVVALHSFVPQSSLNAGVYSLLPFVGVPVIAWLAAYGIDALLRRENYHEVSLLRDYGFYGKVRWVNLIFWILATGLGWGFVSSTVPGFGWLGYIASPLGLSAVGANSSTGVWIAFVIAAISPLFTIREIHNQEAEGRALEERHRELVDVLGEI